MSSKSNIKKKSNYVIKPISAVEGISSKCEDKSCRYHQASTRKYPGFSGVSSATLYRHALKPIDGTTPVDNRKLNKGRPVKLSVRDHRRMERHVSILRCQLGTFNSKELQESCGISENNASSSTFWRHLRSSMKYGFYRMQRKGVLTKEDLKERLKFSRKVQRKKLGSEFWTQGISMYVDAVGLEYKSNPYSAARAPREREWRKRNERLSIHCTAKGSKEGTTQVKFMVGIAHEVGVVLCREVTTRLTGEQYATMLHDHFPTALDKTKNPKGKRILQDGDPAQNSKKAKRAMDIEGIKLFAIPPRSPDLNPIENLFAQVYTTHTYM